MSTSSGWPDALRSRCKGTVRSLSTTSGAFFCHLVQIAGQPLAQLGGPGTQGLLQGLGVQVITSRAHEMADLFFQVGAKTPGGQDGGKPDQVGPGRALLKRPGAGVQV